MSLTTKYACDREGCAVTSPDGWRWLRVCTVHSVMRGPDIDDGYSSTAPLDFCSWRCLTEHAAKEGRG